MIYNSAEHYERTKDNFVFQFEMIKALRDATENIRNLRTLDYGAGAITYPITQFSRLQKDQEETIAFDRNIANRTRRSLDNASSIEWTGIAPTGHFDLVVCHFSLHHMQEKPGDVIRDLLKIYSLELICIADYDYIKTDQQQFADTFISQQEQKELESLFNGDLQACFEYHRQFGKDAAMSSMINCGLRIISDRRGQGIARHKFFIIGKK